MAVAAHDSFERLYRRYARDVYGFALSIVRNPTEAEDVTQTAFLNAFRAYSRGERPERPHSWLIAIAHNAIRSRRRRALRRPTEVALEAAGPQLAVAPPERSEAGAVLRALGALPENQREALAMRELEGRSYGEIAATLGVSTTAVESLIARGRRTLRRQRALLRGLLLLPLRHGDEAAGGFAAKAAAVVAAAGLVAGGLGVESKVGSDSHAGRAPGAAHAYSPSIPRPVEAAAVVLASHSHARMRRHSAQPAQRQGSAAPPPPARLAEDGPAAPAAPAPAAPRQAAPPPAAPQPAAPAAAKSVVATPTTVVTTAATTATTAATVATPAVVATPATVAAPATVATPPATLETPVVTATVPAVTAPTVKATVPQPPPLPLPSVPQVSGLSGIE